MNTIRKCSMCTETKQLDLFSPSNHRCKPCQKIVNTRRNPERNYISARAYQLAGHDGLNFYELPRKERLRWRRIAKDLIDAGSTYGTALAARETRKDGVVYVITHPRLEGVKIGRAFDPISRLKNYQTGCPNREYQLSYISPYVEDCGELERRAHSYLNAFRLSGEWFDCSPQAAAASVRILADSIKETPSD